jgi:hypothetical protein
LVFLYKKNKAVFLSEVKLTIFKISFPWTQRPLSYNLSILLLRFSIPMVTRHKSATKYSKSAVITYFTRELVSLEPLKVKLAIIMPWHVSVLFLGKSSSQIIQLSAWKYLRKYKKDDLSPTGKNGEKLKNQQQVLC